MAGDQQQRVTTHLAELFQDAPREHSVTSVRELSAEEVEEIERADDLIIKSANAAPYQRSREVLTIAIKGISDLQEADPAGPGDVARVRTAFGSLTQALRELAQKLDEAVQEFGSRDAQTEFAEYVTEVRGSPVWYQVDELADAEAGSFKLAPNGAVVWQRRSDEAIVSPADTAFAAVSAAQALLIRQYAALEPTLIRAAKRLRQLAVETPGGAPGLVEITIEEDQVSHMKPRVLAMNRIDTALRAARIATRMLDELEQAQEGPEAELVEPTAEPDFRVEFAESDSDAEPSEPEDSAGGGDSSENTSDAGEGGPDDESSDDGHDGDDEESEAPLPIDFGSVFALARNLDTDLEKVWSAALDETLLDPAVEKQLAAVGTLLSTLRRKIAAAENALRGAGVDARIKEWPLSDASIAELTLSGDPATQVTQSGLAQLDALVAVVENFKSLRQPGNVTVTFGQGGESVERFWSAGAFALLRDRLWLLERATREHERDVKETLRQRTGGEAASAGEDVRRDEIDSSMTQHETETGAETEGDIDEETQRMSEAFERLRLGTRAWVHGDPEAALFHAVTAVARALRVSPDQLADRLAENTASDQPSLSNDEATILSRAADLVVAILEGRPNLPAATLFAQSALRTAHVLILGPIPSQSLSATELAELFESRQPLQPLEPEDDGGHT